LNEIDIKVTKASGELDSYDRMKLLRSLTRAGASESTAESVAEEIESQLSHGISTRKIYQRAFKLLRTKSVYAASQYKIKQAVMQLGPSGYPFEKFVGEVMQTQGYNVKVGQIVNGHCVKHEIDVLGFDGHNIMIAECKFRNQPGSKTDVKVALYVNSRFNDLKQAIENSNGSFVRDMGLYKPNQFKVSQSNSDQNAIESYNYSGWIITNTKFTEDAITYGNCAGLTLLGWDYPAENSLLQMIKQSAILPITVLQSISKANIRHLLDEGIVICRDLQENIAILQKLGIDTSKKRRLISELQTILNK
jgi:hypothetical protein